VAKSACKIRHNRQNAHLSLCINSAPIGRLFVKYDNGEVYVNMSKYKFV